MNDGEMLLAEILANPACDTRRLVYADWLEENGQGARAEFIRVQVDESGRRRGQRLNGRRPVAVLRRIQIRMWATGIVASWFPPGVCTSADHIGIILPSSFDRGVVASVTCTAADWLTHGDGLLTRHPVERVRLTTEPNEREFGTIRLMNWGQRTAVYYRWPRIEFQLPERRVAPEWVVNDLLLNPPPR